VTPAELARAVKQNKVQFIFSRDRVISQAFRVGEAEIGPGYRYLDSYLERVQAVTPADLQRVASTYLVPDNRSVGLYLPYAEGEKPPAYLDALRGPKDQKPARRPGGPSTLRDEDAIDSRPLFGEGSGTPARRVSVKAGGAVAAAPAVVREVLPNGMTLLIRENHGNATVEVRGGAWAGAAFEPASKAGVANLLAEMLDRGTQTRSADRIADELESNGATIRFGAGRERLTFSTRSITDDFPLVVDLLADMLRNSTFPEEELTLARDQVLHQIEERDEDTGSRAELAALAKIYGAENPYGRPLEGTAQTIGLITREDLAAHFRKAFIPAGLVVSIVGDVDPKAVTRLFEEKFPGRKEKVAFDAAELRKASEGADPHGGEIPVAMADKEQVDVVFARRGISRTDPDYYAATMANFIFGGDFTSRLNKELRDNRGLTYGTYSSFDAGMGRGAWTASIGVNPANTRKAKDGVREMMANVVANGVTAAELDEAKTYLTGSYPVRLETNGAVAGALLEAELYGLGLDFIQRYPAILAALTLDEVNRAARKYFVPGDQVMAAAGTLPEE
jgi:zinc protease